MASKTLIDIAIRLGQQLGANTSKFLGTRSNVSFLGSGPKDGMLFQKAINPNAFSKLGVEKVLPDIEASLGYASGGKLNDLQMNKLIDNLTTMVDIQATMPKAPGIGGLGSLQEKEFRTSKVFDLKGNNIKNPQNIMGGEEVINPNSEIGRSLRMESEGKKLADSMSNKEIDLRGNRPYDTDEQIIARLKDQNTKAANRLRDKKVLGETLVENPEIPMSTRDKFRALSKSGGNRKDFVKLAYDSGLTNKSVPAPKLAKNKWTEAFGAASGLDVSGAAKTNIFKNLSRMKNDQAGKSAASGELLLNVFQGKKYIPRDVRSVLQDGAAGDSIAMVEKYFGPKVVELIPPRATAEEMSIFTQRVLNNLVDAKGLRPGDPNFNRLTADFVQGTFASGGRVGFSKGGLAKILDL